MTAVLGPGPVATGPDRDLDRAAPPGPGGLRRLWIVPAAVVVAGALALLPTVGEGDPGPGEAEVRVEGAAVVTRAEGDGAVVRDGSVRLGPGDAIEVTAGRAHFTLARDVTFEGRSGPAVAGRAGTTVVMATVPELVAGPLLVVAPIPVAVRAAGAEVTVGPAGGPGAARLDRRLGLGVGTYRGRVEIDTAGRAGPVPALRRMEVARPGALDQPALPLDYRADDRWDRRFLADALLVDGQLRALLDAFDASAGTGPATVAGLVRARPGLPPDELPAVVAGAPRGSAALVAAILADLGRDGSFPGRAGAIGRFRAEGAPWGLVAMDQGVAPEALLGAVRAALDRLGPDGVAVGAAPVGGPEGTDQATGPIGSEPATGAPAEGAGAGGTGVGPGPVPGPGAGSGGGAADPGPVVGGVPPGGPAPAVVTPPTLPPPVGEVAGEVGGAVEGVVDDVDKAVGGVVDGVGTVVDDVTGAAPGLGDVVDGLLGTAGRILAPEPPDPPSGTGILGLGAG